MQIVCTCGQWLDLPMDGLDDAGQPWQCHDCAARDSGCILAVPALRDRSASVDLEVRDQPWDGSRTALPPCSFVLMPRPAFYAIVAGVAAGGVLLGWLLSALLHYKG